MSARLLSNPDARSLAQRREAISLAASVLASDDLRQRLTEIEQIAMAVLVRELGAMLDEAAAEVLPFRRPS